MLETRIPPPIYALLAGLGMAALHRYLPGPELVGSSVSHWAWVMAAPGGLMTAWAGVTFRRSGTTIDPTAPWKARQLVIHGPYQWSRNPMYTGFALVLLGWAGWLGDLSAFLVLPVFVLVVTYQQILPEERALERRFGDVYLGYKRQVHRWWGRARRVR